MAGLVATFKEGGAEFGGVDWGFAETGTDEGFGETG